MPDSHDLPFSSQSSAGVIFGLNGMLFHFGIYALQGLDFVTWWTPALLAFLVGVPSNEPFQALLNGWDNEGPFFVPAAVYTALQVLTAVTLRDFWLDDVLPFSCCRPLCGSHPGPVDQRSYSHLRARSRDRPHVHAAAQHLR
jgi:hypothetical protein